MIRNPHTVEIERRVAVLPTPRTVAELRRQMSTINVGLPGAPWWYDDEAAGEIVRIADGSRYRIEDVAPLCVRGEIDLHAVDEWVRTAAGNSDRG